MTEQRGFGYNCNVFFEAKKNHRYSVQYFSNMPEYIEISQADTDKFVARAQLIVTSTGDVINHNIYGELITVVATNESVLNNEFYFNCDYDGYIMMHASAAIIVKDLGIINEEPTAVEDIKETQSDKVEANSKTTIPDKK